MKAVALLKDIHPNSLVLLVGDGNKRGDVEKVVQEESMKDRVIFAGRRFDIPQMVSVMDIYCLASTHGEFFPNSIIEAMAMGKPWVGSDIAGLSELTANNTAGWVTPISDIQALASNLDKLISNGDLRASRGEAARKHVEAHLTIEKVVDRILNAYSSAR